MKTHASAEARAHDGNQTHWTVFANYRFRSASFALTFVLISIHILDKHNSVLMWALLAMQFLAYPYLVFLRAKLSFNSQQAEANNLLLDTFLMGAWMAYLQFPLWITFSLWLCCSINIAINRGTKGIVFALFAFFSGTFVSVAYFGFQLSPDTKLPVTLICIAITWIYLLSIGGAAFNRNKQLRNVREQLRLGEQKLQLSYDALQKQLNQVQYLQEQLQEQSIHDPLTGLYNRRYLDTILSRELLRSAREGWHLSIMMIDVDHFKKVNDTYGHQGGDEVLKKLSRIMLDNVRVSDVVCRYGGEEFLVLLPTMSPDIAINRGNQWRLAFEDATVKFKQFQMKATISIGIASAPFHGNTAEELIRCADTALYKAKAEGRNRVVLFDNTAAMTCQEPLLSAPATELLQ